jgi:predicted kinase
MDDDAVSPSGPQPWTMALCPTPPRWTLDWEGLIARFGWLGALADCPQDPIYHAEGDVLRHTRMVCEALIGLAAWRILDAEARSILFAAALLHDIAKPSCTVNEQGRIISPGHAVQGALLSRYLLWEDQFAADGPPPGVTHLAPLRPRNAIVALVRHHHLPIRLLDRSVPQRAIITASQMARCDWLALLAEADVRGRVCSDQHELLERIALFREYAQEQGCLAAPFRFASDHSRFLYFRKEDRDPRYAAFDDTRCEVVLMAGLPGAGKSTWLRQHLPAWPVVALDELRAALRVAPNQDQAPVVARARERARELLREGRSFAWDATNTTRPLRDQLIDLFAVYKARVRIVYVETSQTELRRRNQMRPRPVPATVINRLARRLMVPDLTEAHAVELVAS